MSKLKQRYCFIIKGRVDEFVGAESRHRRFFQGIGDMAPPWGTGERREPPSPDFGKGSAAIVDLKKFFGPCVKQAMITYRYRRLLSDDSQCDDALMIDVDPEKVDLHHLVYAVIPRYIQAFDAYRAEYFDERFFQVRSREQSTDEGVAGTPKLREYVNQRFKVARVEVVSFYDELLCRRAFNLAPQEVMNRIARKVEHAALIHGGVYIVGTSKIIPFDEARILTQEMTEALA